VGYTNAGKSTLLNAISGADVPVEDKLFATLDPTTRRVQLPPGGEALFTDTVGFIQKLPTTLVAAFRATLEEIAEADLLVHVVDITNRMAPQQARAVGETLAEIGADHLPIITALNKIDRLDVSEPVGAQLARFPNAVGVSALSGEGLVHLLERVHEVLREQMVDVSVFIPFSSGDLIALFHRFGAIQSERHLAQGVKIDGQLPVSLVGRLDRFMRG
jgi:GTP-binding protein HflX